MITTRFNRAAIRYLKGYTEKILKTSSNITTTRIKTRRIIKIYKGPFPSIWTPAYCATQIFEFSDGERVAEGTETCYFIKNIAVQTSYLLTTKGILHSTLWNRDEIEEFLMTNNLVLY